MAQITIEYMIMVPVMILQIFLFPYVAVTLMDNWTTSRQTIELQDIASQIGSTVQQMYYVINHASVSGGSASMTVALKIPQTIEALTDNPRAYTVTLTHASNTGSSYQVMKVTLHVFNGTASTSTLVTLGDNINWQNTIAFTSLTKNLTLSASKTANNITLTLGGS
jgi:hypothetical protein